MKRIDFEKEPLPEIYLAQLCQCWWRRFLIYCITLWIESILQEYRKQEPKHLALWDFVPFDHDHYCFCQSVWRRRCPPFLNIPWSEGGVQSRPDHEHIITMLCLGAVILMCFGLFLARPLLVLFGASADALPYAYPYMMIYLIGTLPSMIAVGMNPFINAQGYALIGMSSVAIGAVANLVLDPLFILCLAWVWREPQSQL